MSKKFISLALLSVGFSAGEFALSSAFLTSDIAKFVGYYSTPILNLQVAAQQRLLQSSAITPSATQGTTANPIILSTVGTSAAPSTAFDYAFIDNYGYLVIKLVTSLSMSKRRTNNNLVQADLDAFNQNIHPNFCMPQHSIYFVFKPTCEYSFNMSSNQKPRLAQIVSITGWTGYTNFDDLIGTFENGVLKSTTIVGQPSTLSTYDISGGTFDGVTYLSLDYMNSFFGTNTVTFAPGTTGVANIIAYETAIATNYGSTAVPTEAANSQAQSSFGFTSYSNTGKSLNGFTRTWS